MKKEKGMGRRELVGYRYDTHMVVDGEFYVSQPQF